MAAGIAAVLGILAGGAGVEELKQRFDEKHAQQLDADKQGRDQATKTAMTDPALFLSPAYQKENAKFFKGPYKELMGEMNTRAISNLKTQNQVLAHLTGSPSGIPQSNPTSPTPSSPPSTLGPTSTGVSGPAPAVAPQQATPAAAPATGTQPGGPGQVAGQLIQGGMQGNAQLQGMASDLMNKYSFIPALAQVNPEMAQNYMAVFGHEEAILAGMEKNYDSQIKEGATLGGRMLTSETQLSVARIHAEAQIKAAQVRGSAQQKKASDQAKLWQGTVKDLTAAGNTLDARMMGTVGTTGKQAGKRVPGMASAYDYNGYVGAFAAYDGRTSLITRTAGKEFKDAVPFMRFPAPPTVSSGFLGMGGGKESVPNQSQSLTLDAALKAYNNPDPDALNSRKKLQDMIRRSALGGGYVETEPGVFELPPDPEEAATSAADTKEESSANKPE